MALDNHPRRFLLTVTDINANVISNSKPKKKVSPKDQIVIEFAGHVMPSTKIRLERALIAGSFILVDKTLT